MSIRGKIILSSIAAIVLFGGMDQLVQHVFLNPSFSELERMDAFRDLKRCVQALERESEYLQHLCHDWAAWDDTYTYANDRSPEYESSNFVFETFADNDIDLIFLLSTQGHAIWGRIYSLETKTTLEMPDFPPRFWGKNHPLMRGNDFETAQSGIMLTSRGPMLIAAEPIVKSDNSGPSRGMLVMGRFAGEALIEKLAEQTQILSMSLSLPDTAQPEDGDSKNILGEYKDQPFTIAKTTNDTLYVCAALNDIAGNPAFDLRASLPRDIRERGDSAIKLDSIGTLSAGLLALLMLVVLMRRVVVEPLALLTRHVGAIGNQDDLRFVDMSAYKDEFGTLGTQFNAMIKRLLDDAEHRESVQRELRESEARFQRLMASIRDIVWAVSLDGDTIVYLNEAVETITGRAREEFVAHPRLWLECIPEDHRKEIKTRLHDILTKGEVDLQYPILTATGEERWVHDRRVLVRDDAGQPAHIAGIIADITGMRRMYRRVAETEHLARLGEMSASVAHEIRNPIAGISAALQVIRDGIPAPDPRRDAIEEALGQADRVERTVVNLLQLARPWNANPVHRDLRAWVTEQVHDWHALLNRPEIHPIVEEGPPVRANMDADLLTLALHNVLNNAAQAMPGGGDIAISFEENGGKVRIYIRDGGPGFDAAILPRAFDPFVSSKVRGTGLGLPICRRILEAHQGSIEILSGETGATVVFVLEKGA